jgi:hypothetical protein
MARRLTKERVGIRIFPTVHVESPTSNRLARNRLANWSGMLAFHQ